MELRVYTIKLDTPRWLRRAVVYIAIPAAAILGVSAFVYADVVVPNDFADGDTLSAATINANFAALETGINQLVPPGTVVAYAGENPPPGWLLCDGSETSRSQYAALFGVLNTIHGDGNGSSTFNVPDYRGRFLRGVDGAAGRDPDKAVREKPTADSGYAGNAVGSVQSDALQGHWHQVRYYNPSGAGAYFGPGSGTSSQGPADDPGTSTNLGACGMSSDTVHGTVRVAHETRPANAYVNYVIKY